jgi:hypothetical protein
MNEHTRIETRLLEIIYVLKSTRLYMVGFGTICSCFLIAIFVLISLSGCSGWTYNGIRGDDLNNHTMEVAAGAGTAVAVHALGHFIASAIMGKELHFEGLSEVTDDELTDQEAAWFGRSGLLTANGVGWVAKALGAKGRFWRGYNAGVAFETATYPMWDNVRGNGDDLKMIDRHGYGSLEWGLWSVSSIFLNLDK